MGVFFKFLNMQTAVINRYSQQLEQLKRQIPSQARLIVGRLQDKIIPYITERQLFAKGIDGNENRLQAYTPFTIALKKQKGEVFDRTTLLDTGDFYDDFFAKAEGGFIIIGSTNKKTPELEKKYGKDIFTLTQTNNTEVNEQILTELIEWLLSSLEI